MKAMSEGEGGELWCVERRERKVGLNDRRNKKNERSE